MPYIGLYETPIEQQLRWFRSSSGVSPRIGSSRSDGMIPTASQAAPGISRDESEGEHAGITVIILYALRAAPRLSIESREDCD